MNDYPEDVAKRATAIANEVCGQPTSCKPGWKAKIYNAAWEAAARGSLPHTADTLDADALSIELARKCAERVLMARLTKTPAEKRAKLLERIANVRWGGGDGTPEVQAAVMAVEELRRAKN